MAIKHLTPQPEFKIRYFKIKDRCVMNRKSHDRIRGYTGYSGPTGVAGVQGISGPVGMPAYRGVQGVSGPIGIQGVIVNQGVF